MKLRNRIKKPWQFHKNSVEKSYVRIKCEKKKSNQKT